MRSLVILPTYNEAPHIVPLCEAILAQHPSLEILVVDDSSPDGTAELVADAMAGETRIRLIRREAKLGLGSAYIRGFDHGLDQGFGRILTMDADLSHNPRYLPGLLGAVGECDLVIGSRYVPGGGVANWPAHRRALSVFANFYTRTLLRLPVRDCTSGYRCYRREVLERVRPRDINASGYAFLEEMVWRVHRCGFRVKELPIVFEGRIAGKSKIDQSEIYRAAWRVLKTAVWPPQIPKRAANG